MPRRDVCGDFEISECYLLAILEAFVYSYGRKESSILQEEIVFPTALNDIEHLPR